MAKLPEGKKLRRGEVRDKILYHLKGLDYGNVPHPYTAPDGATLGGISEALYGSRVRGNNIQKQIGEMVAEGTLVKKTGVVRSERGKIETFYYKVARLVEADHPQAYSLAARVALKAGEALERAGQSDEAAKIYRMALTGVAGESPSEIPEATQRTPEEKVEIAPPQEIEKRETPPKLGKKERDLEKAIYKGDESVVGKARIAVLEYLRERGSGTAEEIARASELSKSGIMLALNGYKDYVGLLDAGFAEQTGTKRLYKHGCPSRVFSATEKMEKVPEAFKKHKNIPKVMEVKRAGSILEINPIERMIAVYGAEPEEGKEGEDFGIYNTTVINILEFLRDNQSVKVKQMSKKLKKTYETVYVLIEGRAESKTHEGKPGLVQARLAKRVQRGKNVEYRRSKKFEKFFRDAEKRGYEFDDETSLKERLYYPASGENLEEARQAYSSLSPVERVTLRTLQKADSLTLEKLSRKLHLNTHMAGAVMKKLDESGAVGKITSQRKKGHRYYSVSPAYTKAVKEDNKKKKELRSQPEPEISESGIDSDVYQSLKNESEGGVSSVSVFRNLLNREQNQATVFDIADYYGIKVSHAKRLLESLEEKSLVHKKGVNDKIPHYKVQKWIMKVHGKVGDGKEGLGITESKTAVPPPSSEPPQELPPALAPQPPETGRGGEEMVESDSGDRR
ncbi:MAG TPA: hypothetical protein VI933_02765 [archaeon]|nr:hypothetical protein [archaeon]